MGDHAIVGGGPRGSMCGAECPRVHYLHSLTFGQDTPALYPTHAVPLVGLTVGMFQNIPECPICDLFSRSLI